MSHLYLNHFDLKRSPFQITPDADFFFSGSQRGGILSALIHVACHEEGIATAVAEVGSGKTLLARLMINRLPPNISTIYLANPCFSRDEILGAILRDLGLTDLPVSTEEKLARLHAELLRRHADGLRVLLVIDEAHLMPIESLEEVRLLSNLETSRHKLINIMLFGQPELDTLLNDHRLRQVRDRVIHRFELPHLTPDEASAYIDHRLRIAGWRGGHLFSAQATAYLFKESDGRARRINLLADKSLLAAFVDNASQVEKIHVKKACQELYAAPKTAHWWRGWQTVFGGIGLVAAVAATTWVFEYRHSTVPTIASRTVGTDPAPAAQANLSPIAADKSSLPLARQGNLNKVQAAPGSNGQPLTTIVRRTQTLLNERKLNGFTIQLAALPTLGNPPAYFARIAKHVDSSKIYAHNLTYDGREYVAIFMGHYLTESDAKIAINQLPEPLRANKYSIRAWSSINQGATT